MDIVALYGELERRVAYYACQVSLYNSQGDITTRAYWDGKLAEAKATMDKLGAASLQWTTTPPTAEGWYWVVDEDGPCIAEVYHSTLSGRLKAYLTDLDDPRELSDFTHWLGPLPVPEPPGGDE